MCLHDWCAEHKNEWQPMVKSVKPGAGESVRRPQECILVRIVQLDSAAHRASPISVMSKLQCRAQVARMAASSFVSRDSVHDKCALV